MDVIERVPEFPDGPVFHYTSQKGLLGIVSSKSLWATNILYMNDAAELLYAADQARKQIETWKESASDEYMNLLQYIDQELGRITRVRSDGIYVCSFSSHGDQLSQWRGYCPGGNGFSIGIDFAKLQIEMQKFRPAKCVYSSDQQFKIIKKFLLESLDGLRDISMKGVPDQDKLDVASAIIGQNFLQIAATIKHKKFSEEDEWRLISRPISVDDPRLQFREGKSTIIPYLEFKLESADKPISIEKLYIGPTPHKELAWMATSQLLSANRLGHFLPQHSEVPYRNW